MHAAQRPQRLTAQHSRQLQRCAVAATADDRSKPPSPLSQLWATVTQQTSAHLVCIALVSDCRHPCYGLRPHPLASARRFTHYGLHREERNPNCFVSSRTVTSASVHTDRGATISPCIAGSTTHSQSTPPHPNSTPHSTHLNSCHTATQSVRAALLHTTRRTAAPRSAYSVLVVSVVVVVVVVAAASAVLMLASSSSGPCACFSRSTCPIIAAVPAYLAACSGLPADTAADT